MTRPDFWDSRESSQATVGEVRALKSVLEPFGRMEGRIEDFKVLAELAELEGEESSMYAEADQVWPQLTEELDRLELMSFLSGKMDANNAIMTIHASRGRSPATAAYLPDVHALAGQNGFTYEVADIQPGDEAGTKYVTLTISGEFAYGYLRAEKGFTGVRVSI